MRACVLTGIGKMEIQQVRTVQIQQPDEVLLKMKRVGVCGSDVHYYETGRVGSQVVQYPYAVGHECSAIVAQAGPKVKKVKVGDLVVVDPAIPCYECDQCKAGRENTCRKLLFLGCPGQREGCLSEYLVMPEHCLFPIDGIINMDLGALCEPLSIGLYAVKQSQVTKRQDVAILGSGPIGLSALLSARHLGCNSIAMTDKLDYRVQNALKWGADWAGNPLKEDVVKSILDRQPLGIDIVYECCGQPEAMDQALEILKPGGTLILVGIPREERISFSIDRLRRQEITIINIRRQNRCVQGAIDMAAALKSKAAAMITHRFPFEKCQDAFDLVAHYKDGVLKAMIDFE